MASMEKLIKAFEALKVFHPTPGNEESISKKKEQPLTKKDKIGHCTTIADAMCSSNLRSVNDFPKFLGIAMETFLTCCDDEESDVRMVADECLNRTIKTLLETNLGRLQVELYKEIKKNGSARSLRAALWRFADLCHLIRPQKCRPYVVNLLPCIHRISNRPEDTVQETLASAMLKICPVLGKFTNDAEVKALLKCFLPNLKSNVAVTRRTAATALTVICQYCRKPTTFFDWLLCILLDMVIPVHDDRNVYVLLGVLLCLRHVIPHLGADDSKDLFLKGSIGVTQVNQETNVSTDQLIQVYEVLLYYTHHSDHNVVATALETLQQLFRTPPPALLSVLLSSQGLERTRIFSTDVQDNFRGRLSSSGCHLTHMPSLIEDDLPLDDDVDSKSEISNHTIGSEETLPLSNDLDAPEVVLPIPEESLRYFEDDQYESNQNIDPHGDILVNNNFNDEYSSIRIGECTDDQSPSHSSNLDVDVGLKPNSPSPTFRIRKGVSEDRTDELEETLSRDTTTPASPVVQVPFRVGNIGNFIDPGISLHYCVRLLSSSFLLTGYPSTLMPDKNVRVSVKVLALGSLANMVNLYPQCFFIPLFLQEEENVSEDVQQISDVLLYVSHGDPQMRGQAALLIGNLVHSVICESRGKFDYFVQKLNVRLPVEDLFSKLLCILQDDSSVACRLAILALKSCIHSLFNSLHCHLGPRILQALIQLNSNPYWLVKVELLELLGEIDFKVVSFLETLTTSDKTIYRGPGGQCLQEKVILEVFLILLGDEDFRVRLAAATAIVKVVPKLFYPVEHPQHDPVIAVARELTNMYFDPILRETSFPSQPMVHGLVKPFDTSNSHPHCWLTEAALSRMINAVVSQLISSTSKHLTYGCCQALCLLSEEYLVTFYSQAWGCHPGLVMSPRDTLFKSPGRRLSVPTTSMRQQLNIDNSIGAGSGPLALILSLLTSSSIAWDLSTHQYALQFAGNIFAGAAFKALKAVDSNSREDENWGMLQDKQLIPLAELLLVHLARLLNVCTYVIEEQYPGPPQTKPVLPSLPNAPSLSPIRRKKKVKGDTNSSGTEAGNQNKGSPVKILQQDKSDNEKDKGQKNILGTFYNLPHYMKLYDVLKGAYSNYKISLDMQSNEKFGCVLRCCLEVLSQMMEIATLPEMGRYADELLGYLKSTISMEATMSVLCVQQLLKCLFGTNLASLWEGPQQNSGGSRKPGKATRLTTSFEPGLYHCCFTTPYTQFTQSLAGSTLKSAAQPDIDDSVGWWGWMRRKGEKKLAALMKSGQKGEKTSIASYIRLFEPLVIRALKQYTVTSSIELQCQVLHLLAQLVQLRVNYCLLDSDQIFIGFIIKQFEYIEEGQIRNADMLIPYIFNFLVLLSYERYHSKTIIGVPKIIQLCDGIMASGQPASTHAIPALQPVLQDLFLIRGANKVDAGKELDTQREVVVSMLLRLIQYHQVLEMVIVVLQQSLKEGEDKWKRMSRQVIDIILPLLDKQQINLDNQIALDVLHRLFEAVAPSVFRPVDILLEKLFAKPYNVTCLGKLQRWLCLVLVCLRVLIAQAKEEVVLSRMSELRLTINIFKDSLHPTPSESLQRNMANIFLLPPEETIARFLLQTIGLISCEIRRRSGTPSSAEPYNFLCQQLSHLLLYVTHMFQSGIYRRVANAAMTLVKEKTSEDLFSIDEINQYFLDIAICHPTLTLMWCNVLILINYEDQEFWSKILRTVRRQSMASPRHGVEPKTGTSTCCHLELVKTGGLILFCDYVCVNLNDAEHTTWLIINHVNELICLSKEPPVQDFISAIHRNFAASGLFIQAIHARGAGLTKPHQVKRTLECVMTIHPTQSGALLTLLIDKFLNTHHVALARICDRLACKRVEDLLTETPEDCRNQLPLEDLEKLLQVMKTTGLTKRYARLTSLLNKLRNILSPDSKLTLSPDKVQPLTLLALPLPDVSVNKDWFISITKDQCFSVDALPSECAQLLQKLNYDDIINIMIDKEFNLSILEACLILGVENMFLQNSTGSITSSDSQTEDPLYQAAVHTLLQHISHLVGLLPRPHQVLVLVDGATAKEQRYLSKLENLLQDNNLWNLLFLLLPVLSRYLKSLKQLYWKLTISDECVVRITRLAIFGLEAVDWLQQHQRKSCIQQLQVVVDCMAAVLHNPRLVSVFCLRDHVSWVCSSIGCIHSLLQSILHREKLPLLNTSIATLVDADAQRANLACDKIAELVMWLENVSTSMHTNKNDIPGFLSVPFKTIIVGLARVPLVNSFARTPPLVWQMGWMPEMGGEMKTVVPPLPVEFLQERDVLRQFIFRVNSLGWISRQQFEETWMALLGVLSATPLGDGTTAEEKMERIHTSCLAVKSITSLLLMTLLIPQPGNPGSSVYQHYQRDKPLGFLHTRCGKKLSAVRNLVHQDICAIFENRCPGWSHGLCADHFIHPFDVNLERLNNYAEFSMGQVCLGYIWSITGMYEDDDSDDQSSPVKERKATMAEIRERHLSASGLDLHSCLHFLLDLYSHWLSPQTTPKTPLTLLTEATKSVVALSDIFTEHAQFEWMLDTLMELLKVHPAEDEIMSQYLTLGICKAAAVLGVVSKRLKESEQAEKVKKFVEASLRSAHLPTRIATLYGLLYILEQGSTEEANMFVPLATDYLIKYLDVSQTPGINSEQHLLVMWATVFYIIENYQEEVNDADFTSRMLQLCVSEASEDRIPFSIYMILMWGLERLWLTSALPGGDGEALVKLSVDRLSVPSPQRALVALGLLLACMYAGKEGEKWSPSALSQDADQSQALDNQRSQYSDPEILIIAMERVAVLFDRIKKGFPFEAEVITRILPVSLADFFPIQDIMNKVIGEFLSSQQPHPHLMASVVFQVFENLHAQGKQSVIKDWVMLSLSNFTQRSPLAMAIWSLSCFFVSASTNTWLRALFPHVRGRMGKLDIVDRKLFCLSALDFKSQLSEEVQHKTFLSTMQSVAKDDNPYVELLTYC